MKRRGVVSLQHHFIRGSRGITFIDIIVGVALAGLIFSGLFGAFKLSIELISLTKSRSGALALANEQIEYLRSLPYEDVGTQGGIPSGAIPQTEAIDLNQTDYTRRTLILYVDAPEDGLAGADANHVLTDYKKAKVELTWDHRGRTETVFLVTNIVPQGIETTVGGGTLRISVIDAATLPISGASVRITNPGLTPAVDTTVFTNASGEVLVGGAPAASGYTITVTKPGMSTAQTYSASAQNPNPNPAHLTVAEAVTTSATFAIDTLASKTVRTLAPIVSATFTDPFGDATLLADMVSTNVAGGELRLLDFAGVYEPSGTAQSDPITDANLYEWGEASFVRAAPVGTDGRVSVYYDTGSGYAPVPDSDLPGNASGYTTSPVNLSGLSTSTYASLALRAAFSTSNPAQTPSLSTWNITYQTGPVPIPNISFTMRGQKTIGTNASAALIYKYNIATTTNASGVRSFPELEWDAYNIVMTNSSYDVAEACMPQPRSITPGEVAMTDLYLVAGSVRSMRVIVKDESGNLIDDATARLTRSGYDTTYHTSNCGQAFFPSLTAASDYQLSVSKTGYTTSNTTLTVSGDEVIEVILAP